MIYDNSEVGPSLTRDHFFPNSTVVKGYLLEARLRKILAKNVPSSSYYGLHSATSIPLQEIEEAVEDRVFILDTKQLQYAIALFQDEGLVALVKFLHSPYTLDNEEEETENHSVLLSELKLNFQDLEEMGYPVEVLEDLCRDHEIPSINSPMGFVIDPGNLNISSI